MRNGDEVDLRSLKRFWYLEGGHLRFVVKVDFGDALTDLDELLEIADGVSRRLSGGNHAEAVTPESNGPTP